MKKLSVDQALLKAKSHGKKGEIEEAQNLYRAVLQAFPNNKRAQKGLATLNKPKQSAKTQGLAQDTINQLINLYNQGQLVKAVEQAQALTEQYPDAYIIWNILGAAHKGLGSIFEASKAFKKVTELNPNYAEGFNNLGTVLKGQEKLEEAIDSFKIALALKPDYAEAYFNIGVTFGEQDKLQESIESYMKAVSLKPDHAGAYNNMGNALKDQGKLEEAITSFNKALAINPNYALAYNNMGTVLKDQGKLEEAIENYNKALTIKPDHAEAYNNMGNALEVQYRLKEAIDAYNKALDIKPDYADAIWNRSLAFLSMEDFNRGWSQYEARWKQSNNTSIPLQSSKPRWKPNKSGRVLIWPEQGLGDLIMFSSVIPEIYKQVKKLIVQIDDRLIPLFKRSFPSDIIYFGLTERITEEQYDFHIPIGSLSLYFRKDLQSFKLNNGPYLKADTYKTDNLRSKLLSDGTKNLIGISWHSTNQLKGAQNRVISLSKLASILGSPKTKLISLQYGDVEKDIVDLFSDFNIKIHQVPEINNKNDIDGLASLISACDRIISIDNSTIHLAGALGKKSKLLLPYACDWRWGRNSNKSYWYNSVELYRQKEIGNWDEVISKL